MSDSQPLGMPARDFTSHQLREARAEAISLSAKNERLATALNAARERIAELGTQLDAVTRPPVTLGLLTGLPGPAEADVSLGGRHLRLGLHPDLQAADLRVGQRVAVNDQMLVVDALPAPDTGEAVTLDEVLADGDDAAAADERTAVPAARALVTTGSGATRVVRLAGHLDADALRPGDTLAADLRADLVTARIARTSVQQLVVAETPDVSWDDIGGLGPQIQQIRDSLELPFAHPELYRAYGLQAPKGMLLYGPPGCGKTLIAKAVATSLARSTGAGVHDAAFLNIKGPELLSKFVGETERQIRAIFDQARKVAAEDRPVVIFFDEMEALFRTRGSGVSSDVETMIVPQVLTEIDGVESLNNVVIIGASNREDMIDPAILRPGRFDVKIRIDRPDAVGAQEILGKHLRADLPLDPAELAAAGGDREAAAAAMRRVVVADLYARIPERAVLELTYVSGRRETLYLADFVSGAMLAAVVARAKTAAIKDELAGGDGGLSTERLRAAVAVEAQQNEEITAATAPEAAARVVGHRGEMVRAVRRLTDTTATNRQENA
ncbi:MULTISPECIES: proteasome ATPase [unclassified Actinomyces]|uniref:proteasome ATPase n=1 Tax=unclassified Actinomyces TaxID=2609248 RepID=UPI000D59F939|nr:MULTISPECIES: proteasome ATPase [unclassified Actinomyces]RAX19149.1 proteasome ATPase [Actinomyces sp. Z5]RAX20954.1 proteasome ATPase [Actinomyces sp. Z3]